MEQGTVLRIERISPDDGQGLRTVVFLKGCPLRCAWCSTPESQSPHPEWFFKQARCQHCARCVFVCPRSALSFSGDGKAVIRDRKKCDGCFQCAVVCLPHAIGIYGKTMTVEEVMKEIRKDTLFYFYSGGGVTLSGGDVLLQADFARVLLAACREDCINTMAELDLYGPYENVTRVLEFLDSYFVDIKIMDSNQHKHWTGVDNRSILENILRASAEFPQTPMVVRVPLIPGINDTAENVEATVTFCKRLAGCVALDFLPYHRLGSAAYGYIDRPYPLAHLPRMTDEEAWQRVGYLAHRKLPFDIRVSGRTI